MKMRDNKNKCSVEQGKESIVAATMEKGFQEDSRNVGGVP